ncbi:hypothetical protein [Natronomonas marina]|uniref:hypothetical protein n=1 Tax=Natronomonas marina TaxID=2961939 RepID=UPI0020C9AAC5|nr:hypothetical protein [Natronomonas marina]
MTNDDERGRSLHIDRRTALRTLGTAGVVATGAGLGSYMLSGRGAALNVAISATNPSSVANDRGDLSKVTIDPTFRVEWENFDTAIGKVFYVMEARVGSQTDWSPVFRSTPWLTPGALPGVTRTKPGTTGHFEYTDKISDIMLQSSQDRSAVGEDPRSLPRSIQIANELGRPDYSSASGYPSGVDSDSYLGGGSVGSADDAYTELDNGRIAKPEGEPAETGSSTLTNNGGSLPLVNNFPGAASGYYGAASGTDQFDTGQDDSSTTTSVELRYTFALQTINESAVQYFVSGDLSNDYNGDVPTAAREDPHLENVRPSDIKSDNGGNSVLVMDGNDGYPSIEDNGAGSPAENNYDALQAVADSHPAVISTTAAFDVTVENQKAGSGVTGDSNTGASGGGQ